MNKILLVFALFGINLFAQNTYLIPDAGGPGMAVYVEFIGQHDQKGFFGTDGFNINNSSEPNRIEVSGGSSQFLSVSPFVVSWEGRMISAYVYIDDNANPNSEDYNSLNPDFVNQLEVYINNTLIESYDFHIIQPSTIDPNNNAQLIGRVGANNGIGYVSPRNTIVVDSLILRDAEYDINTNDPDPNTPGNQAYLPVVILSEGPIKGLGPNSAIIASAEGKNAGPGGGGGAGSVGDAVNVFGVVTGASGSDGGIGFTGGGAGGRNIAGGTSTRRDGGNGSGSGFLTDFVFQGSIYRAGGRSLNGVLGGSLFVSDGNQNFNPESSGGGTGHPFGRSSEGYNNNGDIGRRDGQYGGGTGNFGGRRGGDGGYGTDGTGDPNFYGGANAGKRHGNDFGVPLAGGSGGGSGNPDDIGEKGGDGGGGGGAIRIFADVIESVRVRADGADGIDAAHDGGSGSGGLVEISSKTRVADVEYSASPGESAGKGRYRFDVYDGNPSLIAGEDTPVRYFAMSTDSTSFVANSHTLTGRKRFGPDLEYFYKPKGGDWTLVNTVSDENFNIPITFTNDAEIWYGASFLKVNDNPVITNDFEQEPDYILSQAAANYFKLIFPEIECQSNVQFTTLECSESSNTISYEIQNIGDAVLIIDLSTALWTPNDGTASIISPDPNSTIKISPNSASFLILEFDLPPGNPGPINYSLTLENNDFDEDPKIITFSFTIEDDPITILDENGSLIPNNQKTINVCSDESPYYFEIFELVKNTSIDLSNVRVVPEDLSTEILSSTSGNDNFPVPLTVQLSSNNNGPGTYNTKIYVFSDECDTPLDSLEITVNVVETKLEIVGSLTNTFDFGKVKVGDTRTENITFRNTGNTELFINDGDLGIDAPFTLLNVTPILPTTLQPNETITIEVSFSPDQIGEVTDPSFFDIDEAASFVCDFPLPFDLQGEGTNTDLVVPVSVNWGTKEYCFTSIERIEIRNEGSDDHLITQDPQIIGADANLFNFVGFDPDQNLRGNSITNILVELDPSQVAFTPGQKSATLRVFTNDPDLPEFDVELLVNFIEPDFVTDPASRQILLGDVPYGIPLDFSVGLTNNSTTIGLNYIRTENNNFVNIDPGIPIGEGESTNFSWEFTPPEGPINETLTFTVISDYDGCEYPIEIDVFGNALNQDLIFSDDSFNLGTFTKCDDFQRMELDITMEGPGEIEISQINLTNLNGNIEFTPAPIPLPEFKTEDDTEPLQIVLDYLNQSSDYGNFSADLQIVYSRNGVLTTETIPITASKSRLLEVNPIVIDFGDIPILETATQSAIVSRLLLDEEYTYNEMEFTELGDDFLQTFPQTQVLFTKPYVNPQEFDIEFQAKELGAHSSTITFVYDFDNYTDCSESFDIIILANVVSNMELLVYSIDQEIDPSLDEMSIPIYADLTRPNQYQFDIESMKVSVDRSVFLPNSVTGGNITGYDYDGDNLIISIQKNDITLSESLNELAVLNGIPLLGDKKESLVEVTELNINPASLLSSATFSSNTLTMLVCEEGGDRLLKAVNPIDLNITQNSENIKITTNIIESGKHSILVSDINGNLVYQKDWIRNIGSANNYEFIVDNSKLTTGTYFVRLQTPQRNLVELVQVIR